MKKRRKATVLVLVWCFLIGSMVTAQTPDTASIRGRVKDQTGLPIAGVRVEASNPSSGFRRAILTTEDGSYAIPGLALADGYQLSAGKEGFVPKEVSGVQLLAGEVATFDFTLVPPGGNSEVTVFGTVEGVRNDVPQLGLRLDQEKIENTPIAGRKITSLVLLDSAVRPARGTGDLFLNNTLFVVNGSGRRQTSFVIDGSTGDDAWGRQTIFTNIPFAAIQEFSVLTNSFPAEYGHNTGSAINIVTRSGTNFFHGELLAMMRPSGLQAREPLSQQDATERLYQFSGAVSGPIVRDRTHFFLALEHTRDDEDATINSQLAPGTFPGEKRLNLFFLRLDRHLNNRNTLSARLGMDRLSDSNPAGAVGGLNLPSAGRFFRRRTYSAQLSETSIWSPLVLNEASFQFQLGSPITLFEPNQPSTQFVRPGIGTEGESRAASLLNHQVQWADTLSFSRGRHFLKAGGDVLRSSSGGFGREFGGGFVLGQFVLNPGVKAPLSELTIQDAQRFVQSFGDQSYHLTEWLWSVFLQDDLRLTSNFTLNLGLRNEFQNFTGDRNNLAPRLGFAYNPWGDNRTVLRGSYGIYYSQVRANLAADFNINGPSGAFTFSAARGQFGFPETLAPLPRFPEGAVLPPRDIALAPAQRELLSQFPGLSGLSRYRDDFLNPYTQQWTLGLERELVKSWFLGLDYVGQHTIGLLRPVDINAPAPFLRTAPGQVRAASEADLSRPIRPVPNGYRRIVAFLNEGAASYNGLHVQLKHPFNRSFSVLVSYSYSHSLNTVETDTPREDPNDANQLGALEKASSLLDQRHRFVASGWWQFRDRWSLGSVLSLASGRPYNITTGVDNNGDGTFADRPVVNGVVIARNAGEGSGIYDTSVFLAHSLPLFHDHSVLDLRVEAFNLLNHPNIVGRNGIFGNATSGTPLPALGESLGGPNNVEPGRQLDFLVRLNF